MSVLKWENEFHDEYEAANQSASHSLWGGLSDTQREELLLSIEESKDPANLISHEEMKKKHSKWL